MQVQVDRTGIESPRVVIYSGALEWGARQQRVREDALGSVEGGASRWQGCQTTH